MKRDTLTETERRVVAAWKAAGLHVECGREGIRDMIRRVAYHEAAHVADIMARPGMPARRVLALAAKWTDEMLALPDVWRTVETLAGMLLASGTIEDRAEIMAACDGIAYAGMKLPKWKRRLFPTKAEQRATGLAVVAIPRECSTV